MKQSFVVWNVFQRRALSMQKCFGYELTFLAPIVKTKITKLFDYMVRSFKTISLLMKDRPEVIWIQLPPVPLLYIVFLYKLFKNVQIVVDCHNSMIKPLWLNWPLCKYLLSKADAVLVHNHYVKNYAIDLGVQSNNLYILEDCPAELPKVDINISESFEFHHPWILFPSSFGLDEPIKEVLEAARLAPDITFVLTGGHSSAKNRHNLSEIPSNVKLTGFLPIDKFNALLCEADAVMGLTKWEGVQLSVCNEALGAERPMILSDTKLLRELFYKGAVFVNSDDPKSIAEGSKSILNNRERYATDAIELKKERLIDWNEKAEIIMDGLQININTECV